MTRSVRLEPEARAEIQEAARWYEKQRPGLGVDFVVAIDEAIGRIRRLGPDCRPALLVPRELGVLRVVCKRFPFVIFFVVGAVSIRILAVGHERRKPAYWMKRL